MAAPVPVSRAAWPTRLRNMPVGHGIGLVATAAGVLSFVVYAATALPGVSFGDWAEMQQVPARLEVPHTTGFPLYTLLGWLFSLIPVGSVAYRADLLSATAAAGSVAVAVLIAGPDLMQIAFGEYFFYDRGYIVIFTVGMGLYLSAATLNQAALAQGQVRRAAACWIACAIAFVIWTALPLVEDELHRVEVGYLGAATVLCAALYFVYRRPKPREEDTFAPGSPEETGLRLAAGDEGS